MRRSFERMLVWYVLVRLLALVGNGIFNTLARIHAVPPATKSDLAQIGLFNAAVGWAAGLVLAVWLYSEARREGRLPVLWAAFGLIVGPMAVVAWIGLHLLPVGEPAPAVGAKAHEPA